MMQPEPTVNPWKATAMFLAVVVILVAIGVCLNGCSLIPDAREPVEIGALGTPSGEPEWTMDDCRFYDNAQIGFNAAGEILVGIGAGAPTVLAAWPDPSDDVVLGLGILGGAASLVGGVFLGLGQTYTHLFSERCTMFAGDGP